MMDPCKIPLVWAGKDAPYFDCAQQTRGVHTAQQKEMSLGIVNLTKTQP